MEEKEGFIYLLRGKADKVRRRAAKIFIPFGISADFLTTFSLIFAAISGLFFYLSGRNFFPFILLALVFFASSSLLDALDGPLALETKTASKRGDLLDHAFDRYADVFIIGGIVFGGYARYEIIGFLAITGVLLTSYFGAQAQALCASREYRGILGRVYRLAILSLAILLNLVHPEEIEILGLSLPFLGWTMLIFGILGIFTAVQRNFYSYRYLSKLG